MCFGGGEFYHCIYGRKKKSLREIEKEEEESNEGGRGGLIRFKEGVNCEKVMREKGFKLTKRGGVGRNIEIEK